MESNLFTQGKKKAKTVQIGTTETKVCLCPLDSTKRNCLDNNELAVIYAREPDGIVYDMHLHSCAGRLHMWWRTQRLQPPAFRNLLPKHFTVNHSGTSLWV